MTVEGLETAEFVVTQNVLAETETNAYADTVLPGALWTEAEGILGNSERSLTLAQAAADASGESTGDWQIIAAVARAMGYEKGLTYESTEDAFEEIPRTHNPVTGWDLRGVTYERLRTTPVQRLAATADGHDRKPIRYVGQDGSLSFPTAGGRAVFYARPHSPAAEMPDDYPYMLNTGHLQHQWHTLTKTGKVAKLNKLNPGPFVEVNPRDGAELGLTDGDSVEVASRRSAGGAAGVVTDRVRPGCCFARRPGSRDGSSPAGRWVRRAPTRPVLMGTWPRPAARTRGWRCSSLICRSRSRRVTCSPRRQSPGLLPWRSPRRSIGPLRKL